MNTRPLRFALFFTTQGRSLEVWDRLGMLERELNLYRHTAPHFDTVYFFTYGSNDARYQSMLPENIVIIPKPRFMPVMLYSFLLPMMHRRILKYVDILKTNQMDGSWTAVIAKKLFHKKLIVRCGYEWLQFIERAKRGWLKRLFAVWAERFAYRHADVIVHTSHEAISFSSERFGVPRENMRFIPNYIDTGLFAPSDEPKTQGSIIFVGRLEQQKNLPALIEALAGLSVSLTIVGQGSQREMLEQLAAQKQVPIVWKGTVPQRALPNELHRHALFILPSFYEGSPKTLLEAMACGMACVATDVIGSREVIENGVNGILCTTDAGSIRKAVQQALASVTFRETLGGNARKTILTTYSFEKVFEQELSVYTAL
jgi:glycosyltransferase involved in cell wall biosynthesis